MDTIQFCYFLLTLVAGVFALELLVVELKRDLMMLQQNSYRIDRYIKWLRASGDTTAFPRLIAMALFLLSMATFSMDWIVAAAMALFSLVQFIALRRRRYKKPLVFTQRAIRIRAVGALLTLAVILAITLLYKWDNIWYVIAVASVGMYCASHIITIAACWLLSPVERHINRHYYRDAERRLQAMPGLKVIGITGSYGKTSTKHYLETILSEHFDVLMTPGSYNTTMGVIRTVREYLKPYHEVFIVEMGAKQRGDIKEICDLVHPGIGIITAVGEQHLESFKSIENVQATKFELVDSLPAGGLAVLNDDFPYISGRTVENAEAVRYAISASGGADYVATDIVYAPTGTDFTVKGPDGFTLKLHTRLVGECNISNLLAAVIVAIRLGVTAGEISYAVDRIEPVEHRLSMKRTPAGVTIIDDACNSNPAGSKMALEVLKMMDTGKRIVITPGMIELGDRQNDLNMELGRTIAHCADIAIIVGEYNREALAGGIRAEGILPEGNIMEAATFTHAQQMLSSVVAPGDTVLYENDLPDTFK